MATLSELQRKLNRYGDIKCISEDKCFTVLITGNRLTAHKNVMAIQKAINEYASKKYPYIQAFVNDETFLLYVLIP